MTTQNKLSQTTKDIKYKITSQQLENIFNVYTDPNNDNDYFYNILKTVKFPEDLDPTVYTLYDIQSNETWSYIAWKFYQDVRLWWLICSVNQIDNPLSIPEPGTQIKILDINNVKNILGTLVTGNN